MVTKNQPRAFSLPRLLRTTIPRYFMYLPQTTSQSSFTSTSRALCSYSMRASISSSSLHLWLSFNTSYFMQELLGLARASSSPSRCSLCYSAVRAALASCTSCCSQSWPEGSQPRIQQIWSQMFCRACRSLSCSLWIVDWVCLSYCKSAQIYDIYFLSRVMVYACWAACSYLDYRSVAVFTSLFWVLSSYLFRIYTSYLPSRHLSLRVLINTLLSCQDSSNLVICWDIQVVLAYRYVNFVCMLWDCQASLAFSCARRLSFLSLISIYQFNVMSLRLQSLPWLETSLRLSSMWFFSKLFSLSLSYRAASNLQFLLSASLSLDCSPSISALRPIISQLLN